MRISDWSSDVCSSDLWALPFSRVLPGAETEVIRLPSIRTSPGYGSVPVPSKIVTLVIARSEEHTSELQSLMRISYAVFCLKKKKTKTKYNTNIIENQS